MRRIGGLVVCIVAAAALTGCQAERPAEPAGVTPAAAGEAAFVTVAPGAAAAIAEHVAEIGPAGKLCLRVRVVPGGCQGYMHKLDLDPFVSTEDCVCESAGVSVVAARRQVEMLRGARVLYGEADGKKGFRVENPNFEGEAARTWLAALEGEWDKE